MEKIVEHLNTKPKTTALVGIALYLLDLILLLYYA